MEETFICSVIEKYIYKYKNNTRAINILKNAKMWTIHHTCHILLESLSNKKITLPFRKELQWPYIHVDDAVSSIITVLLSRNKHNYSYNVSGPDFPSYSQVADEIKKYYKNFNPSFSKTNKIKKRESFSLKKIKKDINWTPKINIEKGINNFIIGQ